MYTKRYLALVMALVMVFSLVVPVSADVVAVPTSVGPLNNSGDVTAKMVIYAATNTDVAKVAAEASIDSDMTATLQLNYGEYAANSEITVTGQTKTNANLTTLSLGGTAGDGIIFTNCDTYFPGLTRLNKSEGYDIKFVDALGTSNTSWDYYLSKATDNGVTLTLNVNPAGYDTSAEAQENADTRWQTLKNEAFTVTHNNNPENSYIMLANGSYLQMADEKLTVVNSSGLMLDDFSSETSVNNNISNAKNSLTYTTLSGDSVYQLLLKKGTKFSFGASIATVKEDLLVTMTGVTKNYDEDPVDGKILGSVYNKLNDTDKGNLAKSLLVVFSDIAGLVGSQTGSNPVVITFGKPYIATNTTKVDDNTTEETSTAITVDTTQNGNETPTTTVNITTQVTVTEGSSAPTTTTTTQAVTVNTGIQPIVPVNPTYSTDNATVINDATTAVNSLTTTNEATFMAALEANGASSKENVLQTAAAANAIAEAAAKLTAQQTKNVTEAKVVLKTELTNVTATGDKVASVTYDIKPVAQLYSGNVVVAAVELKNNDIEDGQTFTFNIPVPSTITSNYVKVTHTSTEYGVDVNYYEVHETGGVRYVTVTVSHFSEFELAYVDDSVADASVSAVMTLSLSESIDVNMYLYDLKGAEVGKYTVSSRVNNRQVLNNVALSESNKHRDKIKNTDAYKLVVAKCAAKEVGDTITIEISYDGTPVREITYSVKQYCENTCKSASNSDKNIALKDLCRAVLDYGTAAQHNFSYNLSNPANEKYSSWETVQSQYIPSDKNVKASSVSGTNPFSAANATLSLESKVEINFNFVPIYDITQYTFTVQRGNNGSEIVDGSDLSKNGSYYVLKVAGIAAVDLDEAVTVTGFYEGGSKSITYSPLSYAYVNQNVSGHETLGDVLRAMYYYNQMAETYFRIINQ